MTHDPKNAEPVLLVGSMAFDDLSLPTGEFPSVIGGSATYAAMAVSLFAPAQIVAVVGEDFPEETLEALRQRGVDTRGVERAQGKTFRWAGRYAQNLASRETLDTQLNVFADFRPKLLPEHCEARWLFLGNIHPALQLQVLSQCGTARFVAADTMNFWIEGERKLVEEVLSKIDTLTINDEELRQLAGEYNIRKAAARVLTMGPKRLVVKRGEYGAMLFDEAGVFYAPAYPLEVEVDPTGAGDSFAGALFGYLAKAGRVDPTTLRQGLLTASVVASFNVEGVGHAALSSLTPARVTARLEELRRLVQVE
ncbi:MAG: sugar kinase [Polyangiaceae bacterium]|nr:sugar kinase [Polyangiaceae bacterium]MCW5791131.1 sugar kinase [Polyangiaceae bacterium]